MSRDSCWLLPLNAKTAVNGMGWRRERALYVLVTIRARAKGKRMLVNALVGDFTVPKQRLRVGRSLQGTDREGSSKSDPLRGNARLVRCSLMLCDRVFKNIRL